MIGVSRNVRVFVYTQPTDMRLGFDALFARVKNELGSNPLSGDIFLFIGKDRRKAKALLWDGTGLMMYYKRLERTQFASFFSKATVPIQLTVSELQLFFDGCTYVGRIQLYPADLTANILA